MFSRCTIVIFYGHDYNIEPFLKKNRVHFQTGCYYSSAVTCRSDALRPWLPSLMPSAELSPLPLDWTKKGKPGYEFGPDMWKKNLDAAEKDAQLLCDPPCCCPKVVVSRKCIGSHWECKHLFPAEKSMTIDCGDLDRKAQ
jgi:hypothetical protein